MRVLVTGGAGYIGSHASLRLLEDGHDVVSIDNVSRGHAQAEAVLSSIGGDRYTPYRCDLHETERLAEILSSHDIDVLMHFAAFAEVGESVGASVGTHLPSSSKRRTTLRCSICLRIRTSACIFRSRRSFERRSIFTATSDAAAVCRRSQPPKTTPYEPRPRTAPSA